MARSVFYFTDSEELGGAEQALLILLEHLDRRVWHPTVLCSASAATAELTASARALGADIRLVAPLPLGLEGARRLPALTNLLRRERPAVFHAHLSWPLAAKFPLAAAVLARVPAVVATVHLFPELPIDLSNRVQELLLARTVGRYIAVSDDIAARLTARLAWPARKIEVIRNGVPLERLRRAPNPRLREELTGGPDRPVVLATSRLVRQKGLDVLLTAATEVPDARFVFAGDGPDRARLEAEAANLGVGDRILFLGRRTDVPELLAVSDCFVLPSLFEGTSLALLEAMAADAPVVATNIPGTNELIVDGTSGLLVPPRDPAALSAALRRVLGSAPLRDRLVAGARDYVEDHASAKTTTRRVESVYETLLARGRRQRS